MLLPSPILQALAPCIHAGCCAVIELVSRASLYGSYIIEKNGINSKQPANNEESHLYPDGFRSIRYGTIFI